MFKLYNSNRNPSFATVMHIYTYKTNLSSMNTNITQNSNILTHHKLNGPNNVVCKDMLLHNRHTERTIALATPILSRPALLALLRLSLLDIGYHGNGPYLFLPHQVSEVCDGDR